MQTSRHQRTVCRHIYPPSRPVEIAGKQGLYNSLSDRAKKETVISTASLTKITTVDIISTTVVSEVTTVTPLKTKEVIDTLTYCTTTQQTTTGGFGRLFFWQ
jgi:hypothetical protein